MAEAVSSYLNGDYGKILGEQEKVDDAETEALRE